MAWTLERTQILKAWISTGKVAIIHFLFHDSCATSHPNGGVAIPPQPAFSMHHKHGAVFAPSQATDAL